jgi:competence protein ComEA
MTSRALVVLFMASFGLVAQDLPDGTGRVETERLCKQCHELARVTSMRQDRDGWNVTMTKMAAAGMKSNEKDYAVVLDYLAEHFPADAVMKVNVNTASAIELESGLSLRRSESAAVIAYREKNGPYKSLEDLKKVPSIDAGMLEEKKNRIAF